MILASHVIPVSRTGPLVSISFCRLLSFYCCKFCQFCGAVFVVISKLEAQHLLFFGSIASSLIQCLVVKWEKQLKISLVALEAGCSYSWIKLSKVAGILPFIVLTEV